MSLEKKDVIELVLTLIAVIAGSIAASGAFVSASYEQQRVALEEKPAILLSCEPEVTALDVAQGKSPEANAVFLDDRGASWIHIEPFAYNAPGADDRAGDDRADLNAKFSAK